MAKRSQGADWVAGPVERAWGHRVVQAAERVEPDTLAELTGLDPEEQGPELARLRDDFVRHAVEMVYRGRDPKGWREVWDDFWAVYGEEILGEERLEEIVRGIDFEHEAKGPDKRRPESGLRVRASDGTVLVQQWDLAPAPDDADQLEVWKTAPVLKVSTEVPLDELLDPSAKHRGAYSGDAGPSLAAVAVMPKEKQEDAIVAAAIAYLSYSGGTEEWVEEVGS